MDGRIDDGVGPVSKDDLEFMFHADGAVVVVELHGMKDRVETRCIGRGAKMSLGLKAKRVKK